MKRILVPTDFSTIAENAFNYAIELATKFNSELYVYHSYLFDKKTDYHWDFSSDNQPFVKQKESQMERLQKKYDEKITRLNIPVHYMVEEDHIFSIFGKKVTKYNIDLIVMGSKGASGLERVIFGSVAASAIDISEVPVLIIPPQRLFSPFDKIVLASDFQLVSEKVISPVIRLTSLFSSKLILLHVKKNPQEEIDPQLKGFFDDVETQFFSVPLEQSINESINKCLETDQFDLLCMVRRNKGFIKSLFHKSITKEQAFHSNVPLLVLPEI